MRHRGRRALASPVWLGADTGHQCISEWDQRSPLTLTAKLNVMSCLTENCGCAWKQCFPRDQYVQHRENTVGPYHCDISRYRGQRSEHVSVHQGKPRMWHSGNTVGPSVFRQGERTRIHHHNMNSFFFKILGRMIGFFAEFVFGYLEKKKNPCALIF